MLERREEIAHLGATVVAVGFSPAAPLALLAEHLDWPWRFLSDERRILYDRLGLGMARRRDVLTPGTMRIYRDAKHRGETIRRPVEDYRQLGGDAIVQRGHAVRVFRPHSPDDRPSADELLVALRDVSTTP